jgi:hypothetical protein
MVVHINNQHMGHCFPQRIDFGTPARVDADDLHLAFGFGRRAIRTQFHRKQATTRGTGG